MRICPVCVLVSGSWLTLLGFRAAGYAVDPALIAVLMGGSAVGITYVLAQRLPAGRSSVLFKLLVIPPLLAAAYGVATQRWLLAGGALLVAVACAVHCFGRRPPRGSGAAIADIEKKLESCC